MSIGESFNTLLNNYIKNILDKRQIPDEVKFVQTDNIAEVIEKLCIINIRMWMLDDTAPYAKTDSELAEIKRKLDICVKYRRPRLVEAITTLIDDAIKNNKSLKEESVKHYKE